MVCLAVPMLCSESEKRRLYAEAHLSNFKSWALPVLKGNIFPGFWMHVQYHVRGMFSPKNHLAEGIAQRQGIRRKFKLRFRREAQLIQKNL